MNYERLYERKKIEVLEDVSSDSMSIIARINDLNRKITSLEGYFDVENMQR